MNKQNSVYALNDTIKIMLDCAESVETLVFEASKAKKAEGARVSSQLREEAVKLIDLSAKVDGMKSTLQECRDISWVVSEFLVEIFGDFEVYKTMDNKTKYDVAKAVSEVLKKKVKE